MEKEEDGVLWIAVSAGSTLALVAAQEKKNRRDKQLLEALEWCRKEKKGAKYCLKYHRKLLDYDKWPDITVESLKSRVSGEIVTGQENTANCLLTPTESEDLAIAMNTAALKGFPFDKAARDAIVLDILWYRQEIQKKGGRKFVKLSHSAKLALKNGGPGRDFWKQFFMKRVQSDRPYNVM